MTFDAFPPELAEPLARSTDLLAPLGSRWVYRPVVGSTNDLAAQLASDGAPEGTIVVADQQTSGRGRSGHTWFSPAGAGLYVSAILRPQRASAEDEAAGPPAWVRLLTIAAGVALAEGLRAASGLPVQIKWPNDIVVADMAAPRVADRRWRKLAGILAEGSTSGGDLSHVVLGCGINVLRSAYPPDIAGRATSLEEEAGRPVDRGLVLAESLAALARHYRDLTRGDVSGLLPRWRALSPTARGARVAWQRGEERREGVTAGLDEQGGLLVQDREGTITSVQAGEVTWL